MDTLYTLCRSADNHHAPPFTPEQVAEIVSHKTTYFSNEAAENPLVREILQGGTLTFFNLKQEDRRGFLEGPATFFRAHEILRRTRRGNVPVFLGTCEYPHDTVTKMFGRCVPNAKLEHLPWFSPSRYVASLAYAWGVTLLVSHLFARDNPGSGMFDSFVLYQLGLFGSIVALAYTALKSNRSVNQSAPWNSAVYLDLNADLVRRNSPHLAVARKEFMPQQKGFKDPAFYYALARRIEAHGFDEELAREVGAPVRV
ncbi:MAG: hypothetical protein ABI222_05895 [Opitutaceae bacterium]